MTAMVYHLLVGPKLTAGARAILSVLNSLTVWVSEKFESIGFYFLLDGENYLHGTLPTELIPENLLKLTKEVKLYNENPNIDKLNGTVDAQVYNIVCMRDKKMITYRALKLGGLVTADYLKMFVPWNYIIHTIFKVFCSTKVASIYAHSR